MSEELSEKEQREVVSNFRTLREDIDVLYRKLAEVDGDRSEHECVFNSNIARLIIELFIIGIVN